ncbi:hypothetical protein Tco_0051511 [Tanacetum coccineum]
MSDPFIHAKKTKARHDTYYIGVASLLMGNRYRWTSTNSSGRCKVAGCGYRLLDKVGQSKALSINNRKVYEEVYVGTHRVEVTNRDLLKGMERRLGKNHQGWVDEIP